jgi:hypothetical protein
MTKQPQINMTHVEQLIQFAKDHYLPVDLHAHDVHDPKLYAPKQYSSEDHEGDDRPFVHNEFLNAAIIPSKKEKSFNELLYEFLDRHFPLKDESASRVYKRVNIQRSHWSKMLSDRDHQPTKDTLFKLMFAFELNLFDANRFLASAGFAFNRSQFKDLVILAAITQHIYSLVDVDKALNQFAQTTLFSIK